MKRTWLNFLVDSLTLIAFLGLVWTGCLMEFILPHGRAGRGVTLWGMGRHDWGEWHLYCGYAVIGLIVVHLVLHWQWIATMVCRLWPKWKGGSPRALKRNLIGLVVLVVSAGGLVGSLVYADSALQQGVVSQEHDHDEGEGDGYRGGGGGWRGGRGGMME